MVSEQKQDGNHSYTFGYSKATISSHASRTIDADAGFVIPHVKPHHRVLDVGSGPGTITIGFANLVDVDRGGCVVGVDAGEEASSWAAQLARDHGLSEAVMTFRQGNVLEGLPFEDESFDVVFASHTITHLAPAPDAPVRALKEMRRVLKPGGFLATRDGAAFVYEPYGEELQRRLTDRIFAVIGTNGPCGPHMQKYLRAAGWDMDHDILAGKVKVGAGTTVLAGKDRARFWYDTMGGRLARGDPFRESWLKFGFTAKECDESQALLEKWSQSEDAWYGTLHTEILAWK